MKIKYNKKIRALFGESVDVFDYIYLCSGKSNVAKNTTMLFDTTSKEINGSIKIVNTQN